MVSNVAALLRAALNDARFSALCCHDVVAHLMGVSEFNALSVTVESPLEDYFDELKSKASSAALQQPPSPRTAAVTAAAQRLFEVYLERDTDVPCDVRSQGLGHVRGAVSLIQAIDHSPLTTSGPRVLLPAELPEPRR